MIAAVDPSHRRHRLRNLLQGILLLGGMALLLAVCALVVFGPAGFVWVLTAGAVVTAVRPRVPSDLVLRMYGARPLPPSAAPVVHEVVTLLAKRAQLPAVPRLYYVPSRMLNAFAVGSPDDAAVGVTDGLLRSLGLRQLAGVLAHEIGHIRSGDLRIMTLADAVGRLTHLLSSMGVLLAAIGLPMLLAGGGAAPLIVASLLVAAPTVSGLLQLALSRSREYDADLEAAALTGDPEGLAQALEVLGRHEGRGWERLMVPERQMGDPILLRTHPPIEERVRRLRALPPGEPLPLPSTTPLVNVAMRPVRRPPRLRYPGIRWCHGHGRMRP